MCGIVGQFSLDFKTAKNNQLKLALDTMRHRGPNDQGIKSFTLNSGQLQLGHTRLSIIDLSPGGHQPMDSPDGQYCIVFNGEIYNYKELRQELIQLGHRFDTASDTQVLLAAWSQWKYSCLPKLIGMFAFAIFDRNAQTLTLVRDAFGIKPLFYYQDAQRLVFASELPAMLQAIGAKPTLNFQRAFDYLAWGSYDDQRETLFNNIVHLQAGHWIEFDLPTNQSVQPIRWWWPSIEERKDLSFEQASEQFRELLLESVRLHLRSDVPLGIAVSGGLDSSSIVSAIRFIEPDLPIHTFSFIAANSKVSEESWMDQINQHVRAHSYKTRISPGELLNDLNDLILSQGEPFNSTSIYAQYRVFKLARENGITVTLDGQGGDECLAGYSGYPHGRAKSLLQNWQFRELTQFTLGWGKWPDRSLRKSVEIVLQQACPHSLLSLVKRVDSIRRIPQWLNLELARSRGLSRSLPCSMYEPDSKGRGLVNALRNALTVQGLQSLLRHGDRNSMRWSIESRVPFLTVTLAEFLLVLPEAFLLSPTGETKRLLRSAMRGIVPDNVLDRRDKIGFLTPESDWLRGIDLDRWLNRATLDSIPLIKPAKVYESVRSQVDGKQPYNAQTWRILNFCRWFDLFQPAV